MSEIVGRIEIPVPLLRAAMSEAAGRIEAPVSLLRRLTEKGWKCYNGTEDEVCHFCGRTEWDARDGGGEHAADCPYVAAKAFLDGPGPKR